jgi:hypothetical protein
VSPGPPIIHTVSTSGRPKSRREVASGGLTLRSRVSAQARPGERRAFQWATGACLDERPVEGEIALSDGWPSVGGSVLIDGQVHRSTGAWTSSVHALLRHLHSVGFDGAPSVVGFDQEGREVLTWVEGDAP